MVIFLLDAADEGGGHSQTPEEHLEQGHGRRDRRGAEADQLAIGLRGTGERSVRTMNTGMGEIGVVGENDEYRYGRDRSGQ